MKKVTVNGIVYIESAKIEADSCEGCCADYCNELCDSLYPNSESMCEDNIYKVSL